MSQPKISIIVPVYNAAKYLHRCLDSLVNQTLSDLEILLFDDCSTDNSVAVIQEYQARFGQVKLIENTTNKGAGYNRNEGIRLAQGKYLLFVDADDWIVPNACESLYRLADTYQLQILSAGHRDTFGNGSVPEAIWFPEAVSVISGREFLLTKPITTAVWNKLWLRDFVIQHRVKNEAGRTYEDLPMVLEGYLAASRVAKIDCPFYFYFQANVDAITKRTSSDKHLLDRIWLMEYLQEKYESLKGDPLGEIIENLMLLQIQPALGNIRRYRGDQGLLVGVLLDKIRIFRKITATGILSVNTMPFIKRLFIYLNPRLYLLVFGSIDRMKS